MQEPAIRNILREKFSDPLLAVEILSCRLAEIPRGEYLLKKGEYVKLVPRCITRDFESDPPG